MSSEERLERIQQDSILDAIEYGCRYGSRSQVKTECIIDDVNWLIAQAKETKRLREENYQLRIKYENTGTIMDRSVLRAENKRLREALAFYAGESHYELWQERDGNPQTNEWTNDVTYDAGERARKALEEK